MAAKTKTKKEYTSIKIGEYEVTVKGVKKKRVVVSRVDVKVAAALGVKGSPDGIKTTRTIKKGAAAGAKIETYQQGTKGKGYGLKFVDLAGSSDLASKTGNTKSRIVKVPVASGVPLAVVAKFANSLKKKPQSLVTPAGVTVYLNTSKTSQGR
jgi:hypothetical protein